MDCNTLLSVAVILASCIQLSYQLEAKLCYRRERELECGVSRPIKKGALMKLGSVTIMLATNTEELETKNQDGRTCDEIATDCTVSIRPSNFNDFPTALQVFYEMFDQACSNKTKCTITMPDWDALSFDSVDGHCEPREDGGKYHLKSVYLDLPCNFPPPTTTAAPTSKGENDVEFTDEATEEADETVEETMDVNDNTTDIMTTDRPEEEMVTDKEEEEVQEPPSPGPGPKNTDRQQVDDSDENSAHSLYKTTCLISTLMLFITALIAKH